jgi:soluble lytic murein transglycosylase-like protein
MVPAARSALNTLALLSAIALGFEAGVVISVLARPPGIASTRPPRPRLRAAPVVQPAALRVNLPPPSPAAPPPQAPDRRAPEWLERAVCQRVDAEPAACRRLALAIHDEATAARLDPVLVLAVIQVESSWDAAAVSRAGAHGLMQLRHGTFRAAAKGGRLGSNDLHQPEANVRAGIRYLGRLQRAFRKTDLALVAYNAGPNRLSRYLKEGGVPDHLKGYPKRVRRTEKALRKTLLPKPAQAARPVARGERKRKARRG